MHDTHETLALCSGTALPESPGAPAPEWVHLLPLGQIRGRDGRHFVLSRPDAVVRASLSENRELPIDYEHQQDDPAKRTNGPVPAAGWITELQTRENGIWGRVSWTDRAAQMIASREYRFLSPVLTHRRDTGAVLRLTGASLVHRPNLELQALSSEDPFMNDTPTDTPQDQGSALAPVAEVLGLNAEATAAEILAEIARRETPDPARYMPMDAVRELLQAHGETTAALSQDRVKARVDDAMTAGYITPGMRDWAMSLCSQDPESFDAFLQSAMPTYAHLSQPQARRGATASDAFGHSAEALEIAQNIGVDPARLNG